MDLVFVRSLISDPVLVKPHLLGSNYVEVVARLLRATYEGVCSRHGFIMPGSIVVQKVLSSRVEAVSLNGDVRYDVAYFANVCNPAIGSVITGRVINMNRFGVLVHSGVQSPDGTFLPVVETIVTRQAIGGMESEVDLDSVEIGEVVRVQIAGKKFELNDDKVSVIGRLVTSAAAPSATAVDAVQSSLGRFALSQGGTALDYGSDDDEADVDSMDEDDVGVEDATIAPENDGDDDDDDEEADEEEKKRVIKKKKKKLALLAGDPGVAEVDSDGGVDDGDEGDEDDDDDDDDEDDEDDEDDDIGEDDDSQDDVDGDEAYDDDEDTK